MALFNHATKELTARIVYYGPGLSGKSSNLRVLHERLERGAGKLLSLSTAQDRTIYFDLLPVELGNIKGYTVRFQVCTVPGQVFYNETRKLVLRGVDGLVFVVDSQWSMLSHNLECFQNLKDNLHDDKISLETLPMVIQYNKRDLPTALSVEALQDSLGFQPYPYLETVASEGTGVIETFKLASKLTFVDLLRRFQRGWQPPAEGPVAVPEEVAAVPEETPALALAGSAGERTTLAPAVLLAALADPPPAAPALLEPPSLGPPPNEPPMPAPAMPAPATPVPAAGRPSSMDEKLAAVLAEARKSARRVSGPHHRLQGPEEVGHEARDLADRRLEEAVAGLRAEIHGELARLRDEIALAREAAAGAQSAATLAAERTRRLEDALRQALRDLAG